MGSLSAGSKIQMTTNYPPEESYPEHYASHQLPVQRSLPNTNTNTNPNHVLKMFDHRLGMLEDFAFTEVQSRSNYLN